MAPSRRRRVLAAARRWVVVGATVALSAGILIPWVTAWSVGGIAVERLLTTDACGAVLRDGIPLLGREGVGGTGTGGGTGSGNGTGSTIGSGNGTGSGGDAEAGSTRPTGFAPWLLGVLTGVSVGEPLSFLSAHLPYARSSYAAAIVASGRPPAAGVGEGGRDSSLAPSPGSGSPAAHPAAPPPKTGAPGEDAYEETNLFRYYGGRDPVLAIVHTHGSESFAPAVAALALAENPRADVSKLDPFTVDTTANMVRVGEELAGYLSSRHGLAVVQACRLHDLKEEGFRLGAYGRSLETMTTLLREHPRVQILLDLHRDAPSREITTATIDRSPAANILIVVGTDRLLENPQWQSNYNFAKRLVVAMEEMYPGLSRGILVRDERYNQHLMERTLLLEIGGQGNTLEEVLLSARYLGEVLARLLAQGVD